MGGFAVNIENMYNILKRVTLTRDRILYLAKYSFFYKVSRKEIEDKSKVDILVKGLVYLQVLWIIR